MSRTEPAFAIVMTIALCGLLMATARQAWPRRVNRTLSRLARTPKHQQRLGRHRFGSPQRQVSVHFLLEGERQAKPVPCTAYSSRR